MPERRSRVLGKKRLLLFKSLLERSGSDDVSWVEDISTGFDLTGRLPVSNQFDPKYRPAKIPPAALRRVADCARQALLGSVKSSGDDTVDQGVYEATLKELSKCFLRGPVDPSEVPAAGTLTRRFGVLQRGKVRPIDDYKASLVNSSVTQVEVATLHGVHHIACIGAQMMKEM